MRAAAVFAACCGAGCLLVSAVLAQTLHGHTPLYKPPSCSCRRLSYGGLLLQDGVIDDSAYCAATSAIEVWLEVGGRLEKDCNPRLTIPHASLKVMCHLTQRSPAAAASAALLLRVMLLQVAPGCSSSGSLCLGCRPIHRPVVTSDDRRASQGDTPTAVMTVCHGAVCS